MHSADWRSQRSTLRRRLWCGAVASLALLALPLMAAETTKPSAAVERALKERAEVFWQAKVREDYATQYSLLEPKVRRQLSLNDYIKQQGPVQYQTASVDAVNVDEAQGSVTVRIRFSIKLGSLVNLQNQEKRFKTPGCAEVPSGTGSFLKDEVSPGTMHLRGVVARPTCSLSGYKQPQEGDKAPFPWDDQVFVAQGLERS